MLTLSSGARTSLTGQRFTIGTHLDDQLDLLALLVDERRKAASDADLVFWNAPGDRHGVRLLSPGRLRLRMSRVPASIQRIILAASRDGEPFAALGSLRTTISGDDGSQVVLQAEHLSVETVVILGEIYRHQGAWRVSSVGAGYANGLAGLLRDHGIDVEDDSANDGTANDGTGDATPAPPPSTRPAPGQASNAAASGPRPVPPQQPVPVPSPTPHRGPTPPPPPPTLRPDPARQGQRGYCVHCSTKLPRKRLSFGPCPTCTPVREAWLHDLERLLATSPPSGLDQHWRRLHELGLTYPRMRPDIEPIALAHLQTVVHVAFADSIIEQHEIDDFDAWVAALSFQDHPQVTVLRGQLLRGQQLSLIRSGVLPRISVHGLHLQADETPHLQTPATYVKRNASGERLHSGRLLITSRGVAFSGVSGHQYTYNQVLRVDAFGADVHIQTTRAGGEYIYRVVDADIVAATAEGALRIAKRLVIAPGQRDSRRIPHAVKVAVFQRDGGKCVQCGRAEYLEYDHEIPWSLGGATSEDNLRLLCRRCNQEKGARI
ncbi:TerD family protein [Kineococcus sp. SYSU DK003]|uniref:TerD family protein n=1 Tax=Kineococcus sp. SYSU DK003 TaxID=3383124 RepID=UPI003D7E8AE6